MTQPYIPTTIVGIIIITLIYFLARINSKKWQETARRNQLQCKHNLFRTQLYDQYWHISITPGRYSISFYFKRETHLPEFNKVETIENKRFRIRSKKGMIAYHHRRPIIIGMHHQVFDELFKQVQQSYERYEEQKQNTP